MKSNVFVFGFSNMFTAMMVPFYIPLALGWIMPIFIYSLVEEKAKRIVVMMKIVRHFVEISWLSRDQTDARLLS